MSKRRGRESGDRSGRKWEKTTLNLPPGHGWKAKPGYNVFVADRGAVRFDFPAHWVVLPGKDGSIRFHDKRPPADDCVLAVSVIRLPPVQGGWEALVPLEALVAEAVKRDGRGATPVGEVVKVSRPDLELAWAELSFIDPNEKRPARSRCCLARARGVQPLITMDYWESDAGQVTPVWDEVLRTLQVGVPVGNPMSPREGMN